MNNIEEIMLRFKGNLTSELLSLVLRVAEKKLKAEPAGIKKRVFHILVECMQNIWHHSALRFSAGLPPAIMLLGKQGENYFIITGNPVKANEVKSLRFRLDELNNMNCDEVNQLYRETLHNEQFSDKGGAGLGLINMRKKSGKKIEHTFRKINEQYAFFTLKINFSADIPASKSVFNKRKLMCAVV